MKKKLLNISVKFAAYASPKIGLVKKDVTMYPYSATEEQVRKQVYGIEYNALLFKTARWLVENDEKWRNIAIEMGCIFKK